MSNQKILIYNSLTNQKEEFNPINKKQVNMYTCGVTVYDDCHIGHARSLYVFDVIRKYLEYRNFKVNFVRNITDIDDKIIKRAQELNINWQDLSTKYIESYYEDLKSLGIDKSIGDGKEEPKATSNIQEMIEFISGLINNGYAYAVKNGVYFRVRKFKKYGELSGQDTNQMHSNVRIEADNQKEDSLDFALWKNSKQGEPSWESPWGPGRPGWHIECSVMSQKYLKTDTLDIHGGGRDLIFPHHENEKAQSEARTGKPFVNYWIHHGLLTINGQKMSKSLGNFITIKDFITKHQDADILKLFFLSAHYTHPVDYTEEKIEETKKQQRMFNEFFDKINLKVSKPGEENILFSEKDKKWIDDLCFKFEEAMNEDFNTPRALGCLFELIDAGNGFISSDKQEASIYVKERLEKFFNILGLKLKSKGAIPPDIERLALERDKARKQKDFKQADKLREEIELNGYVVTDTASTIRLTVKEINGQKRQEK